MSLNFNAQQFREVYEDLGIDFGNLGCIMLDVEKLPDFKSLIPTEALYYSPRYQYVQGLVGAETPHVTLLFGILPGVQQYHVDTVLDGWFPDGVRIFDVDYFASPYEGEEYYCIVAHIDKWYGDEYSESLVEAHARLSLLPHINTFPEYSAHLTLAYIKKDTENLDQILAKLNDRLVDLHLEAKGINYGDRIT